VLAFTHDPDFQDPGRAIGWLAGLFGIPIPGDIATLLAVLCALMYFAADGWVYYGRRGRPAVVT
jgi:hypothetical protein